LGSAAGLRHNDGSRLGLCVRRSCRQQRHRQARCYNSCSHHQSPWTVIPRHLSAVLNAVAMRRN
jgi:hypothetical protein